MIARGPRYGWQNSGHPLVVRTHQWADALATARPRVTESYAAESGGITLAYAGLGEGLTYVLPFLEERRGPTRRRVESRTSWADISVGRTAPDAHILVVGCLPRQVPMGGRSVLLPLRVNLVASTDGGPAAVLGRVSRKARQQYARESRSRDRALEIGRSEQDFAHFYDRMHVPTMRWRHGDATRSLPRETARTCLFRRGVLFFLTEGGERVAGMLCRLNRGALVIRLAGVRDGSDEPYRSGTYMALYISIIEWAAAQRIPRVDLSGCEPFLSKGIFQFKRKIHPDVLTPVNHFAGKRLWLQVRRDSVAARDFMVDNPMLALTASGGLEAVYFHDTHRPPRLDLRWECPRVAGHRLVDLDRFLGQEA